ncbi:uncharacterized protein PAC_17924 [Phialocephala subalpina]|uniref:Uncharacterized protein n=1 Tax=Phialocephala subalpina TaxID=576137 RepID=A0A1L7XSM1_9HELO|nr:uncharacterized protein PAC_17924 [Phialocephala subalpina]
MPVRCSTPVIALGSRTSNLQFFPRFLARSNVKMQTFFATSASTSLPLTITGPGSAKLQGDSIKTLELIRDNCTSLATLETSLHHTFPLECADYKLDSSPIAVEALDLLDARFKAISSLKEVIVDVYVYDDKRLSDDLRKKMRDCGWTIKVTKLEQSEYGREEDEYTDYEYEMKREQEREDEAWLEEYYRRRRDPYWKNDSDYD